MKIKLLIGFLIWIVAVMYCISSYGQTGVTQAYTVPGFSEHSSQYNRPAGHHLPATETTTVLNQGKPDCQHDWVSPKPKYTSSMVTAVWENPDSDRSWEILRICKNCLRHEQIKYFSKWVLNKDEYGELVKKIK